VIEHGRPKFRERRADVTAAAKDAAVDQLPSVRHDTNRDLRRGDRGMRQGDDRENSGREVRDGSVRNTTNKRKPKKERANTKNQVTELMDMRMGVQGILHILGNEKPKAAFHTSMFLALVLPSCRKSPAHSVR
jgi:hypothetical protein